MLNARSVAPRATMLLPIGQPILVPLDYAISCSLAAVSLFTYLSLSLSLSLVFRLSFVARSPRYLWNLLDRAVAAFRLARSLGSACSVCCCCLQPALYSSLEDPGDRGTFQSSLPSMPVRRTPCQIAARFCRSFSKTRPDIASDDLAEINPNRLAYWNRGDVPALVGGKSYRSAWNIGLAS